MSQNLLTPSSNPASITPTVISDGTPYAVAVPITSSEADLWGGSGAAAPDPIATTYGQAISAVVQLSINGIITANLTYVVVQMDMGDGVWVDMNWIVWTATQGSATFFMSNGAAGANTFQQTRNAGSAPSPQASGSNQMPLGGRIRFVGKSFIAGGSSSIAGLTTQVSATIRYKLLGLR